MAVHPHNHLARGDDFRGVYISQNLSNCNFKYVQFIACQVYLTKAVNQSLKKVKWWQTDKKVTTTLAKGRH